MIAITNPNIYSELDNIEVTQNILLTTAIVDSNLTGSAIINESITTAVKKLLKSIIQSTEALNLDIKPAINRMSEYAGFELNSTGSIIFDSTKVSLDKLTFYVIFKLPYSKDALEYEDPLPISSVDPSNTDIKWGKYANHIRSLTGSGIKKINSAGEQVNSDNKPVDDNGNVIEGWSSENAYKYLGVYDSLFPDSLTARAESLGLKTPAEEKSMLFDESEEINKIPVYFYLLAKAENAYVKRYWLNNNTNSTLISRVPHWPSGISTKFFRKHYVKISNNPDNISNITEGTYDLLNDNLGTYFIFSVTASEVVTNHKIYIEELDNESLNFENLTLSQANEVIKTGSQYMAVWKNKYDNPKLKNNSGLTVGMGVDIGATFNGYYKINIDISISGTGTFRLYYGGRRSSAINANVTCTSLRDKIKSLIEDNSGRVRVTNSNGGTSGAPAKIIITRQFSKNNKAYNHRIYAYDLSSTISVNMTPFNEEDRWEVNSSTHKDGWYFYNQLLNYSFSNSPNGEDFWINQLEGVTDNQKEELKIALKKSFGCRSKSGYHIWAENKELLKKVEIKSYTQNLRATYHKFFIEKFYNKKRTLSDGTKRNNGSQGKFSLQYILEHPNLKAKPNQAELFAMVLLNYNWPGQYKKRHSELIEAINQHSISKLKATLVKLSPDRKKALKNFIGTTVITKLYHGIED